MREKPHRLQREAYQGIVAVTFTCCFRPRGINIATPNGIRALREDTGTSGEGSSLYGTNIHLDARPPPLTSPRIRCGF